VPQGGNLGGQLLDGKPLPGLAPIYQQREGELRRDLYVISAGTIITTPQRHTQLSGMRQWPQELQWPEDFVSCTIIRVQPARSESSTVEIHEP
jgi:hypothetical protein